MTPALRDVAGRALGRVPAATPKLAAFVVSPAVRAEPWALYSWLQRTRPVLRSRYGAWLVSRHRDVSAVLASPHTSVDERQATSLPGEPPEAGAFSDLFRSTMLFRDPPAHERLRRLVSRAFTPRRVAGLRPTIDALVSRRLDALAAASGCDVVQDFAYPLPVDVICELLGIPERDRPRIRAWVPALAARLDVQPLRTPEVERAGDRAAAHLRDYLDALVTDDRLRTPGGLLDALVASRDEDVLSRDEVISSAALLLVAGHETGANLVANGVLALMRNPREAARLRAGDVSAACAVDELLRYCGPVQLTQRVAVEPLAVGGETIPAGALVVLLLGAANRDPDVFADPQRLDLTRSPNPHLAFSFGLHACLGAPLARLEAEIALPALLRRFPALHVVERPRWRDTFVLRGLDHLRVRW